MTISPEVIFRDELFRDARVTLLDMVRALRWCFLIFSPRLLQEAQLLALLAYILGIFVYFSDESCFLNLF